MGKERFDELTETSVDELYAVSGSGTGFPSDKYVELTLGASGSEYEAPANGYVYLVKASTAASQYANIYNGSGVSYNNRSTASGQDTIVLAQVFKGKNFKVEYNLAGETKTFRFIYAEGE